MCDVATRDSLCLRCRACGRRCWRGWRPARASWLPAACRDNPARRTRWPRSAADVLHPAPPAAAGPAPETPP